VQYDSSFEEISDAEKGRTLIILSSTIVSRKLSELHGSKQKMSSLKDTVEKLRNLEAEKKSLLLEIEELKRMADDKAAVLENEIATLRDEVKSLKTLMGHEEKQQQPSSTEYLREGTFIAARGFAEKTIDSLNKSGNQVFAASPFSQYFDDWLVNLRKIVSDFELNSPIKVDNQFVKDRSQIFLDVERALTQKKLEEKSLVAIAKAIADNNDLLGENEKGYGEKSKEISLKRFPKVERLTYQVHELERDVENQEEAKDKLFKRRAADKLAKAKLDLGSAKKELEVAQHNFTAEKEKIHDHYQRKKQEINGKLESLRKELEKQETDASIDARQAACKALANAVDALIQRAPLTD